MHRMFALMAALGAASTALAVTGFDGEWNISFGQVVKYGVTGEAAFSDGKGYWMFRGGGTAAKENPCLNKRMPAEIRSVADSEVQIDMHGDRVLAGCPSGSLVLHQGADGAWSGMLDSGYSVVWTRK